MAEETKIVKHENIFEALSAFQGENPEITRSSKVSFKEKNSDRLVEYSYAPLDEILKIVRPLLAKHGLSVSFGGNKDGQLICSLYHSTYKMKRGEDRSKEDVEYTPNSDDVTARHIEYDMIEEGVIRSLPIKVKRADSMKDIGSDSTYARRYMLAEVLGIASDEDKDANLEEKAHKNVESFAYITVEKQLKIIKKEKDIDEKIEFLKKELEIAKDGKKAPSLGLKTEQYEKLLDLALKKKGEIIGIANGDITVIPEEGVDTGVVESKDLPEDLGGTK